MKHIKLYEEKFGDKEDLNRDFSKLSDRMDFVETCTKGKWEFNNDKYQIKGDFICNAKVLNDFYNISDGNYAEIDKLPVEFGNVSGDFVIHELGLTTLEGCPEFVGGDFDCSENHIESLEHGPKVVNGNYYCYNCSLETLEGIGKLNKGLYAGNNKLTKIEGLPKLLKGHLGLSSNFLTDLKGAPETVEGAMRVAYNNFKTFIGAPISIGEKQNRGSDGIAFNYQNIYFNDNNGNETKNLVASIRVWGIKEKLETIKDKMEDNRPVSEQNLLLSSITPKEISEALKTNTWIIMCLKRIWKNIDFKELVDEIVVPEKYKENLDILGDLSELGF